MWVTKENALYLCFFYNKYEECEDKLIKILQKLRCYSDSIKGYSLCPNIYELRKRSKYLDELLNHKHHYTTVVVAHLWPCLYEIIKDNVNDYFKDIDGIDTRIMNFAKEQEKIIVKNTRPYIRDYREVLMDKYYRKNILKL